MKILERKNIFETNSSSSIVLVVNQEDKEVEYYPPIRLQDHGYFSTPIDPATGEDSFVPEIHSWAVPPYLEQLAEVSGKLPVLVNMYGVIRKDKKDDPLGNLAKILSSMYSELTLGNDNTFNLFLMFSQLRGDTSEKKTKNIIKKYCDDDCTEFGVGFLGFEKGIAFPLMKLYTGELTLQSHPKHYLFLNQFLLISKIVEESGVIDTKEREIIVIPFFPTDDGSPINALKHYPCVLGYSDDYYELREMSSLSVFRKVVLAKGVRIEERRY